jgi:hypothetical protein
MHRPRFLTLVLGLLAVAITVTPASVAAPPTNDNFDDATIVTSLPYTQSLSVVEATTEPGEPGTPWSVSRTVWWTFTPPADVLVRATRGGCCQFLSAFRADGSGLAGLTPITGTSVPFGQTFSLEGATTYYFQSGDGSPYGWTSAVTLTLEELLPPPNDDFADAMPFTSVPFSHAVDATAATLEPGEPMACSGNSGTTVWYAFTPTTSGSYGQHGTSSVNVYTGNSLDDLTSVVCSDWPGLYFYAEAGTTYYLQATNGGVSLDVVPPPDPGWDSTPGDPSRFDEITFRHGFGYWDPTITEYLWDFGDGTDGSGNGTTHRYLADGDYDVTLTVNARGGRTASQTRTVQVRTHDVSIKWSSVPGRGRVGRASPIEVGVGNTRYAETVQVDYYKSTLNGWQHMGSVTKAVPVMNAKKTVFFSLSYTFTEDDLATGKVSFQIVASIQGARDSFTGDNTVTPAPTLITR